MARSLHLSFICIPQSTRALDQGGVEPRQAVSPKALRPWTIPLRYSVGCAQTLREGPRERSARGLRGTSAGIHFHSLTAMSGGQGSGHWVNSGGRRSGGSLFFRSRRCCCRLSFGAFLDLVLIGLPSHRKFLEQICFLLDEIC